MDKLPLFSANPIAIKRAYSPIPYPEADCYMQARVGAISGGAAREQIWFLEHPALYTAGTSAKPTDLITPDRFDVFQSGRGGQYTYHGPGQRVVYVMLDLTQRGRDLRCFVSQMEAVIIDTLAEIGVKAGRRDGRVGVWVNLTTGGEAKIAALGVRVRKWVTFHGVSINVSPDLSHFSGIVPCGITEHGVTSLHALGHMVSMAELDAIFERHFSRRFGPVEAPID